MRKMTLTVTELAEGRS